MKQNRYTLSAYLQEIKALLDGASPKSAKSVAEHLWLDSIVFGIYPDPYYIEADIAIAELQNHRKKTLLAMDKEIPEFEAKIIGRTKGDYPDIFYTKLPNRESELLSASAAVLPQDAWRKHKHIALECIRLLSNYSTYFKRKPR